MNYFAIKVHVPAIEIDRPGDEGTIEFTATVQEWTDFAVDVVVEEELHDPRPNGEALTTAAALRWLHTDEGREEVKRGVESYYDALAEMDDR